MSDDVRFTSLVRTHPALGLIPLVLLVALTCHVRTRVGRREWPWFAPIAIILLGEGIWNLIGLSAGGLPCLAISCAATLAAACLTMRRHDLKVPLPALLCAYVLFATLTLELTWNSKFFTIGPQFWAIELTIVACAALFLWFVSGRRSAALIALNIALFALGVAQHYVVQFRGTSILPSDVLAFKTALSVSAGYTYVLTPSMLLGAGAMALGIAFVSVIACHRDAGAYRLPRDLAYCAASVAVAVALVVVPSYADVFGADIDYWWSKDWYERQGFIPSFVYAWQDLRVSPPHGYSAHAASSAETRLAALVDDTESRVAARAQFKEVRPNIIVIQNETFCDLSVFGDLGDGYQGPVFFKGVSDGVLGRGDLAVSVFGGGTCNTEFEFLCGCSLAFLGTAKYPFAMYDLRPFPSLAKDLRLTGYATIGIHPNVASNWNRDRAYTELGFDEFLTIDDFEGAETFHDHVSDAATYERVLDLIAERDKPLFVFDVTMQNHSGYDTKTIDEALLGAHTLEGLTEDDEEQLREFIACIDESDRAFADLLAALREAGEPTVVCMYGDHHPWLSETLNDLTYPDEDPLVHAERIHNTDYLVWANYDVAGAPKTGVVDDTSADMLATLMLDAVGGPLSTYRQAQLGARSEVRALNASGWRDLAGSWHALTDQPDLLHDLALVEFREFGSKI